MPSIPPLKATGFALILSTAGAAGSAFGSLPLFSAQSAPAANLAAAAASIPEISAALLGGIGFLLLLCTRRNR